MTLGVTNGHVEQHRLSDLRISPRNPRRITDEKMDALKRSLEEAPEMLSARPLVALPDGTVIVGNQRLLALRALGVETAPVLVVDLDPAAADAWMVRDNETFGEWDDRALAELLQQLERNGVGLDTVGFGVEELENLLAEIDAVPETSPEEFAGGYADGNGNPDSPYAVDGTRRPVLREVTLLIEPDVHEAFVAGIRVLERAYGTSGVIETTVEAVRREAAACKE